MADLYLHDREDEVCAYRTPHALAIALEKRCTALYDNFYGIALKQKHVSPPSWAVFAKNPAGNGGPVFTALGCFDTKEAATIALSIYVNDL